MHDVHAKYTRFRMTFCTSESNIIIKRILAIPCMVMCMPIDCLRSLSRLIFQFNFGSEYWFPLCIYIAVTYSLLKYDKNWKCVRCASHLYKSSPLVAHVTQILPINIFLIIIIIFTKMFVVICPGFNLDDSLPRFLCKHCLWLIELLCRNILLLKFIAELRIALIEGGS